MRFVLIAEGETERRALPGFLGRWLNPKLTRPVGIRVDNMRSSATLLREIVRRSKTHLSSPVAANDLAGVIGLVDFRDVPFPPKCKSVLSRYAWITEKVQREVAHPRFRMHCAVHELEAWILSQPGILPTAVADALPKKASNPEELNFDRPPSRILQRLYWEKRRHRFMKTIDGVNLIQKLDPDVAYGKCPFLQRLLDDMLYLAIRKGR